MNAVLDQTLRLACLIRDSDEARAWRVAWNSLQHIQFRTAKLPDTSLEQVPFDEYVGHLCLTDQARSRPLLFPLLLLQYSPHLDPARLQSELQNYPQTLSAYRTLTNGLGLIGQLVTFLRGIGPGYPHEDLIYTLPTTPWAQLSIVKELPWQLGESLIQQKSTGNANQLGLHRFVPSVAAEVAIRSNDLVKAIRSDDAWRQLDSAYDVVSQRKHLVKELREAKSRFKNDCSKIGQVNVPRSLRFTRIEDIARKVYSHRAGQVQAYVQGFLQYEELIERIYWLISQVVMYERISCLASTIPEHIQQISLSRSRKGVLTALSATGARTLQVGQIIYIELPETDHVLDGLYQIEQWVEKYQVDAGFRILFRARCLWNCRVEELAETSKTCVQSTFIPTEAADPLASLHMSISNPDGTATTFAVKDRITALEIPKAMHLF